MTRQTLTRTGFTLVELLVVIGVIAVIIGLLMPALSGARRAAGQTRAIGDVRQLLVGHQFYRLANAGAFPWGYPPTHVNSRPVTVTLRHADGSTSTVGGPTAQRYPWRIAPFVGEIWRILHAHDRVPDDSYLRGLTPTFGINSVFAGGHDGPIFQGFVVAAGVSRPNVGKHVVFRESEVRRADRLILFADARPDPISPFASIGDGVHYLLPPRANGEHWRPTLDGRDLIATSGMYGGLPRGRFGRGAAVGFLDGHAESLFPGDLADGRLWCPRATTPHEDPIR